MTETLTDAVALLDKKFQKSVDVLQGALRSALPETLINTQLPHLPAAAALDFRFWQVEPLLNQASDILERALRTKKEADEYWIRYAQQQTDFLIDEAADTLATQQKEDRFFEATQIELEHYRQDLDTTTGGIAGDASGGDMGGFTKKSALANSVVMGDALSRGGDAKAGYPGGLARNSAGVALIDLYVEQCSRIRSIAEAMKAAQRADLSYRLDSGVRKHKRTNADNAQPLDYVSRIDNLVKMQLMPDLIDAIHRCAVAANGLHEIYRWNDVRPPFVTVVSEVVPTDPGLIVENLLLWVRNAVRWVQQLSHHDQAFVYVHSLTTNLELDTPILWSPILERLTGYDYVRLRGVSAFVETKDYDPAAIFIIELSRPRYARIQVSPDWYDIDQLDVPGCLLGRVSSRASVQGPMIGGAVSLLNISPIPKNGEQWTVTVKAANSAAARAKIREVQIEFGLTGVPLRAKGA